ncbi:MAG TPA: hypothetical protein VHV53_07080 [Solirubrobacterales bacterium]|jgi:hypothetical protein|nr:hypothetical protein [Solirubrobacterales bacterium]
MRTTIDLADDVVAAIEKARRERGLGLSEAVNDLVRAGLLTDQPRPPIDPPAYEMGPPRIDYSNIGEVLELLDAEDGRGLGGAGSNR